MQHWNYQKHVSLWEIKAQFSFELENNDSHVLIPDNIKSKQNMQYMCNKGYFEVIRCEMSVCHGNFQLKLIGSWPL